MTEKEKMISGKLYDPSDKELAQMRKKAHNLCIQYNSLFEDDERRKELLNMLIPNKGKGAFFQGQYFNSITVSLLKLETIFMRILI